MRTTGQEMAEDGPHDGSRLVRVQLRTVCFSGTGCPACMGCQMEPVTNGVEVEADESDTLGGMWGQVRTCEDEAGPRDKGGTSGRGGSCRCVMIWDELPAPGADME